MGHLIPLRSSSRRRRAASPGVGRAGRLPSGEARRQAEERDAWTTPEDREECRRRLAEALARLDAAR